MIHKVHQKKDLQLSELQDKYNELIVQNKKLSELVDERTTRQLCL